MHMHNMLQGVNTAILPLQLVASCAHFNSLFFNPENKRLYYGRENLGNLLYICFLVLGFSYTMEI